MFTCRSCMSGQTARNRTVTCPWLHGSASGHRCESIPSQLEAACWTLLLRLFPTLQSRQSRQTSQNTDSVPSVALDPFNWQPGADAASVLSLASSGCLHVLVYSLAAAAAPCPQPWICAQPLSCRLFGLLENESSLAGSYRICYLLFSLRSNLM